MQQIVNFILRNKTVLLFLLLFSISILFTIQSHSYHKSKFINSANYVTGGIYNSLNNFRAYFNLKYQNELLANENAKLRALLNSYDFETSNPIIDSLPFQGNYTFFNASVIKNSYSLTNNFLTINKGKKNNIQDDYGVISSKGIIGIIDKTSAHYASVLSILSSTSRISAQLKKTNHFGTLKWDGKKAHIIQLVDVEKIAPVMVGDTIITSGRSAIFPKGIPIGTIANYHLDAAKNFYTLNIELFNDMTNIEHVYVIKNSDANEIFNLEAGLND